MKLSGTNKISGEINFIAGNTSAGKPKKKTPGYLWIGRDDIGCIGWIDSEKGARELIMLCKRLIDSFNGK